MFGSGNQTASVCEAFACTNDCTQAFDQAAHHTGSGVMVNPAPWTNERLHNGRVKMDISEQVQGVIEAIELFGANIYQHHLVVETVVARSCCAPSCFPSRKIAFFTGQRRKIPDVERFLANQARFDHNRQLVAPLLFPTQHSLCCRAGRQHSTRALNRPPQHSVLHHLPSTSSNSVGTTRCCETL